MRSSELSVNDAIPGFWSLTYAAPTKNKAVYTRLNGVL